MSHGGSEHDDRHALEARRDQAIWVRKRDENRLFLVMVGAFMDCYWFGNDESWSVDEMMDRYDFLSVAEPPAGLT
jgi:hypothetical protein